MPMDDQEIIAKLLQGYSLRTRMVPDPSIPGNHPEHVETYDLPHVVIKGGLFWAKTETSHLVVADDEPQSTVAFCYTNSGEFFLSFRPGAALDGGAHFMNIGRYREHEWVLRKSHKLVWDSEGGQPAAAVRREIEAAAKLKIAMLDSEDIWNIHPVDLPMYYPGTDTFDLKTVNDDYPLHFRHPTELLRHLETTDFATSGAKDPRGKPLAANLQQFKCYYQLSSDGSYRNIYDIPRATRQNYKALRVFSDTL